MKNKERFGIFESSDGKNHYIQDSKHVVHLTIDYDDVDHEQVDRWEDALVNLMNENAHLFEES